MTKLSAADVIKAGGRLGKMPVPKEIIDQYAIRALASLTDAPNNEVRRKALEKALRMLKRR